METGLKLGHYEVADQIGVGGMGEVWQARDTRLGRPVALKFLPEAFVADSGRHARFHAEAQALATFAHPNVAGIHALEEIDGHHFLVMELVEGADLSTRLQPGALDVSTALGIARQLTEALAAAHAAKIIHRDLKPANIKVTDDNRVKVLDFGLAKIYHAEGPDSISDMGSLPTVTSEMTAVGSIVGTAAYMSPEQARGKAVDQRTDIWAFGCVLCEMLTGKLTFGGETASDTLAALLRAEPDWDALPAAAGPRLRRLLQRCLAKNPDERLHDINDARLEIDDILAGGDVAAAATASAPGARKWRPVAVMGWLAAVALLGAVFLRPAPPEPEPPRVLSLTHSGRDWAPDASPDGKTVAFVSDRDGTARIWIKQMATGNEAVLTEGPDDRPRFSPDGSQVLFVRDDGRRRSLLRTAVVGGQPRKLMDDAVEADWSPDGERVAFARITPVDGNNLVTIGTADVQTGEETVLTRVENRTVYALRWSPDGQWLSYCETSLTGNQMIANTFNLVDAVTGETQALELVPGDGAYTGPLWSPDSRSVVVGTGADLLAYSSGAKSLVIQVRIDGPLLGMYFWENLRTPRGGWGYTSFAALGADRLVFDHHDHYFELQLIPLADGLPTGEIRQLTTSLGRDRQPVVSPDGTRVLFASNRAGNVDLWELDIASGLMRQVTDDPAHDWDPAYTPDGRNILWSSDREGHMEVWMADVDGSGARRVTSDGQDAENPTMTADGQWIVYASGSSEKLGIWRVRPDGSDALMIAEGSNLLPEVSPDGKYALHSMVRSLDFVIGVVEVATGERVDFEIVIPVVGRDRDVVFGRARWSHDGTGIVYVGQDEQARAGIFRQEFRPGADTMDTRVPLAGFVTRYDTESLGVAPDGSFIVVAAMHHRRIVKLAEGVNLRDW